MEKFNFKRRRLYSGTHLLGLIVIAAGLFSVVSPTVFRSNTSLEKSFVVGAIAIILGFILVSSYGGTRIDFNKKMVKDYYAVLGYQVGEWAGLPTIKKVAVVTINYKATNTRNGVSPTWSGTVTEHKVLLYSGSPTPEFSFSYSAKEPALEAAKLLAARLNTVCEIKEV